VEGPRASLRRLSPVPYTDPYHDAALYDLVYAKVRDDIPFYLSLARQAGGPVLEIACGTGRVMIPILEAGVEIHGLDLDPHMLAELRRKAAARGLEARTYQGDMRDFTMPGRYRLVIVPFRAFLHMESSDDQIRALLCMREHLEPGGLLALNVFYPAFETLRDKDGVRWRSIEVTDPESGRPIEVYDVSRYDRVRQQLTVARDVIQRKEPGSETVTRLGFSLRWIYRFEMELLLRAAGFARVEILGGFDRRPLTRDTDEMVVQAWRD